MSNERNLVMVRFAEKDEPYKEWLKANETRNGFDPQVLDYPCTKILAAHTNGTVFAYMPVQSVPVLESIGPNPEASPLAVATAVMEMTKGAALMGHGAGMREMFFLGSDENTAAAAKGLGFEDLTEKFGYHVFRARLK